MTLRTRLDLLAERGVVTFDRLLAAGCTAEAVWHARDSRRLFERYPRVYAVGRPELTREGEWLAAVWACGERAVLSHVDAAVLYELLAWRLGAPNVTVPTQNGVATPRGIVLHRSATLRDEDRALWRGIPATSLQRTLLDVAMQVDRRALRAAIRQAVRRHGLDLRLLADAVEHPRTSAKHARVRRVLDDLVVREELTESELEARFLELCVRARLPVPEPQVRLGSYRADFAWKESRLIVETDGAVHDGPVARLEDRRRDRYLKSLGYEVLRFTWAEVVNRPARVARELRAAIARRRREVQSRGQG